MDAEVVQQLKQTTIAGDTTDNAASSDVVWQLSLEDESLGRSATHAVVARDELRRPQAIFLLPMQPGSALDQLIEQAEEVIHAFGRLLARCNNLLDTAKRVPIESIGEHASALSADLVIAADEFRRDDPWAFVLAGSARGSGEKQLLECMQRAVIGRPNGSVSKGREFLCRDQPIGQHAFEAQEKPATALDRRPPPPG